MQPIKNKHSQSSLVKICGITSREQCLEIAEAGSDFIGINFWPKSKRFLSQNQRDWLPEVNKTIPVVGVFVNPTLQELHSLIASESLSYIQLHGDESPEFVKSVQNLGLPVIKAFQIKDEESLKEIAQYELERVLLDAYHPTERGGLGEVFPWRLATEFLRKSPESKLYLAGGLNAENVAEAVQGVHPYAVDVASGVEGPIPGIKEMNLVRNFINAAKSNTFPPSLR